MSTGTGYSITGRVRPQRPMRGFVVALVGGDVIEIQAHHVQFSGSWLHFYRESSAGMDFLRAYPADRVDQVDGVPLHETTPQSEAEGDER